LTQHVDEPRRNDSPACVDALLRRGFVEPTDRSDASRANANIGRKPGRPSAVDDSAVLDDEVVRRRSAFRGSREGTRANE
jgi:hypothetical protein